MTIDVLPDNVRLEIFELYLGKEDADLYEHFHNYDRWQTLAHVCCRWRCIVFVSPRRLDLKLSRTRRRSVNSKMLDVWPALPIVIVAQNMESKEDVTNVTAAFGHRNRVCKRIYHNLNEHFQDSFLEEFAAIDEPFPALTSLDLGSLGQDVPVLPDSFLGGSAPRLRSLHSNGIPYPSIGNLLSSTTNLVRLSPLAYSSFRIYFTRGDRPLSVYVGQARITFSWIPIPSISGPASKLTSAPAHPYRSPHPNLFGVRRRYRVLGGHPVSNRNTHAQRN